MARFAHSIALLLLLPAFSAAAEQQVSYSVGVLNQQSVIATAELWNPLLGYLGKKTGSKFTLAIGNTVQETDSMTARGDFDLVYTNHIFSMPIERDYRVLVQWGGEALAGAIVSTKPMRLTELAGKTIAFPSPDAFAATVITWGQLAHEKIKFTPHYAGNQEGCLAALSKGLVDAASVTPRFALPYTEKNRLTLHTVYQSGGFPQIPLLAHKKRISAAQAQKITDVLLNMPRDVEGSKLLETLKIPPFKTASEQSYDVVRMIYADWHQSQGRNTQ